MIMRRMKKNILMDNTRTLDQVTIIIMKMKMTITMKIIVMTNNIIKPKLRKRKKILKNLSRKTSANQN